MAEGLFPGRGCVPLLGVRKGQHAVDVHGHLPVRGRSVGPGQLPDPRSYSGHVARIAARAFRPDAARAATRRGPVGSEATGPNTPASARSMPTSARRPPVECHSKILPGSCTAHGLDHGVSAADTAVSGGLVDGIDQQRRAGLGNHPATAAIDTDTWAGPAFLSPGEGLSATTHRTLSKSYRCSSEPLSASRPPAGQHPSRRHEAKGLQIIKVLLPVPWLVVCASRISSMPNSPRSSRLLFPHLDERQRRLLMATEARVLGHRGVRAVARAASVS